MYKTTTYIQGNRLEGFVKPVHIAPKLVFIDCGARQGENFMWDGVTPDSGIMSSKLDVCMTRPDIPFVTSNLYGAEIHLFEPNTMWEKERHEIAKQVSKSALAVYVHDCAVWYKNEVKNFYVGIDEFGDLGSSLCNDKNEKLDRENPLSVYCIDLPQFLIDNFSVKDDVIIKIDVEGAEYDILPHMVNNISCMERIGSLFIEWHPNFFPQKHMQLFAPLLQVFRHYAVKNGLHYAPWHPAW